MVKSRAAVTLGRRGGKARAATQTADERKALAKLGAQARWGTLEKCPCGRMTAKRAQARGHHC